MIIQWSPLGDAIGVQGEQRLFFGARTQLNEPLLDPRIKVFAFDDRTVAKLGRFDLTLPEWATVFETLANRKPAGIFLDKLFDNPTYKTEEVDDFVNRLSNIITPVVPIAFVKDSPIPYREHLEMSKIRGAPKLEETTNSDKEVPSLFAYGPRLDLLPAFKSTGHALYSGDGHVQLYYTLKNWVLPHWSLNAADKITFHDSLVSINNLEVPQDSKGRVIVNLASSATYRKKAISFLPVYVRAMSERSIPIVNEGDYVVILPAMYTGNTDWRETPHGSIQGGYIMVAMLNSVLTGEWIEKYEVGIFLVLLFGVVPFLFRRCSQPKIIAINSLILVIWIIAAFTIFIYFNKSVPWMIPACSLMATTFLIFSSISRNVWVDSIRMQKELETAQLVQSSFFPVRDYEAIKLAALYEPSSECGGDWWGHFSIEEGVDYIFIADATGHGVGAALVTAMSFAVTQSVRFLKDSLKEEVTPARLCSLLNNIYKETQGTNVSMTFFAAKIDAHKNQMTYCNGGHNFPFTLPSDKKFVKVRDLKNLRGSGDPIGFTDAPLHRNNTINLLPGDRFIFFTDGIFENENGEGKAWGLRGFKKSIIKSYQKPLDAVCDDIRIAYEKHMATSRPEDDVTILILEFAPNSQATKFDQTSKAALVTPENFES